VFAVILFAVRSERPDTSAAPFMGGGPLAGTASDISQLSPDEIVDRLFNRVMAAWGAGKTDSVDFFAPMAINSFEALAPLTPHRRYDLGLIHLVSGQPAAARAQADTILAGAPKHLLGLTLALRTAVVMDNESDRKRFAARFLDALKTESARDLAEYNDHSTDITEATAAAEGRAGGSSAWVGPKRF